ncbi:MAG: BT4734/BF3469 family protein [Flavobacteriaceae bacterium]
MTKDFNISNYRNCKARSEEKVSIFSILSRIKFGDYSEIINKLRETKDKEEIKNIKSSNIPAFTFSVNCNGAHRQDNINEYLGIICLDYDDIANPAELRDLVSKIDTTMAAFISPRGRGVKVFIQTNSNQNNHKETFEMVDSFYYDITNQMSDPSVKDLTRLCLVSYDQETYINEDFKVFDVKKANKLKTVNKSFDLNYIFDSIILGFKEGNRHQVLISCAGKANRFGIQKDDVISFFSTYTDSTFTFEEIDSTVSDIYNRYSHQFNTTSKELVLPDNNYNWLEYDFNSKTKNQFILTKLSKDIVIHEHSGNVFRKDNGVIDFESKLNMSDFFMKLEDCGLRKSEAALKRLISSEKIKKITSFDLFHQRLLGNPWDGENRIPYIVMAANLKGDYHQNIELFTRWLCTVYSYAFRDIDKDIHHNTFSRVVLILYSQQRGVGKTTFFQKLGMFGEIKKKTGVNGLDIYSEFAGSLSKDDRELSALMESKMIIQIDDIDNALINGDGTLRSIISKKNSDKRVLYTDNISNKEWRGVLCGSTNHKELIRNNDENRYLIFESNGVMNFDLINSIDYIQLWSQIRYLCKKENDLQIFDSELLELVRKLSQDYIYSSGTDEIIAELFEFDPNGRMTFKAISEYMKQNNPRISHTVLGTSLKKLPPPGESVKVKINGSFRYRLKRKEEYPIIDSEYII